VPLNGVFNPFFMMEKVYVYVGIDVSKDQLDVALANGRSRHFQVANAPAGFTLLLNRLPAQACCVMEATGAYHCQLAFFLAEQGIAVVVVNPLSAKHFAQMNLRKTKTDKADAALLAEYGQCLHPPLWQPPARQLIELKQLYAVVEQLTKQQTALLNQKQALQLMPHYSQKALEVIDQQLIGLQQGLAELEKQLQDLLHQHYDDLNDRLQSIPGIGPASALLLIVVSQAFQAFEHANQLIAYVGLAPRIYQSGKTSLKNHISKQGTARLRKVLYVAAWSAKRYNKGCQDLYDRLLQKGKPPQLALIAVANKLIKQAFAIAKAKTTYQKDYQPNFILQNT
jgi:transposase